MRRGEGPFLLECKTYRWRGHYEGEADRTYLYRSREEIEDWMKKCPIQRMGKRLMAEEILDEKGLEKINKEVTEELEQAVAAAQNSPFPKPEDALKGLYAE